MKLLPAFGGKSKSRVSQKANRFREDEGGAMIIFGLIIFVMMLMAGGMAVDFIRFEHERARLQYTLDRAILASTALNNPLDPEAVVADYMAKADLPDHQLSVRVPTNTENARLANANASLMMNTFFVNMLGIPEMEANARAGASELIPETEISLVLDVSGSMGGSKLADLKQAAKDFVDLVITDQNQDNVSISIIPYNMQVNVGQNILDQLNVTSEHSTSHCVDFDTSDYNSTAISSATELQRAGHFTAFVRTGSGGWAWEDGEINHPNMDPADHKTFEWMCPITSHSEIMAFSQNKTALKTYIDNLQAGGNTSTDIGTKWGAFLLDPSANAVVQNMAGVDPAFMDRPAPYSDNDTIKALVVMTDGVHTTERRLNEAFRDGLSDVWIDPDSTVMSTRYQTSPDTYWNSDVYFENSAANGDTTEPVNAANATQLSWTRVWELMTPKYYNRHHIEERSDTAPLADITTSVYRSTKDNRLSAICGKAKNQGIKLYTIAFDMDEDDETLMRQCATAEADFFAVGEEELSDAFEAIASTIQRLRLTH